MFFKRKKLYKDWDYDPDYPGYLKIEGDLIRQYKDKTDMSEEDIIKNSNIKEKIFLAYKMRDIENNKRLTKLKMFLKYLCWLIINRKPLRYFKNMKSRY